MRKSNLTALAAVLLLTFASTFKSSAPDPNDITLSKYQQLKTGMSQAQVVAILGKPGVEISSGEFVPGYQIRMLQWFNEDQSGNMNATFQNDRLTSKAQFGLR